MKAKEIIEDLKKLYVPASRKADFCELLALVGGMPLRDIGPEDAGSLRKRVLMVFTKGKPHRCSYSFHCWHEADFGEMGPKMATIAVYLNGDSTRVAPVRVAYKTHHILTIDD